MLKVNLAMDNSSIQEFKSARVSPTANTQQVSAREIMVTDNNTIFERSYDYSE